MAKSAQKRRQILMLRDLITSSYSLKMFDAVETSKRELSDKIASMIALDGPGFRVRQAVTRRDFEQLIDSDVQAIAVELDAVMARAGLRTDQIDAVIRTGGSAQIPAFIALLDDRFGPEKVRAIDTFSSVTSGLGILGHHIDAGTADLPGYHRAEWGYGPRLKQNGHADKKSPTGAPKVDLDLMKQFIDLEERQGETHDQQVSILAITTESDIQAATETRRRFEDQTEIVLADLGAFESSALDTAQDSAHIIVTAPEDRVLLMTSDYRFLLRYVQDVAELAAVGMNLAEMESLYADKFGREVVRGIAMWDDLQGAERIALVSSRGEIKVMYGDALLENLDQLHPYQLDRLAGDPVALIPANTPELILVTNAGSIARLRPDDLITGTQRAIRLRKDERIVAAFGMDRPADVLLAESNGRGKRINTRAIPFVTGSDLGTKVFSRRALTAAIPLGGFAGASDLNTLWAITTHRLIPLDVDSIPLDPPTPPNSRAILKLRKGETLLALQFLN